MKSNKKFFYMFVATFVVAIATLFTSPACAQSKSFALNNSGENLMGVIHEEAPVITAGLTLDGGIPNASESQTLVFSLTLDKGANTGVTLETPNTKIYGGAPGALSYVTVYRTEFKIENGKLNIKRYNISPYGPNAGTTYSAVADVPVPGNKLNFSAWGNETMNPSSVETVNNLYVNDALVNFSLTTDFNNKDVAKNYINNNPIFTGSFDTSIFTQVNSGEVGLQFGMYNSQILSSSVPEPSSFLLVALSSVLFFLNKKRRESSI